MNWCCCCWCYLLLMTVRVNSCCSPGHYWNYYCLDVPMEYPLHSLNRHPDEVVRGWFDRDCCSFHRCPMKTTRMRRTMRRIQDWCLGHWHVSCWPTSRVCQGTWIDPFWYLCGGGEDLGRWFFLGIIWFSFEFHIYNVYFLHLVFFFFWITLDEILIWDY